MSEPTPEAIIGAAVIEVDQKDDCIYHIVLEHPDGRIVELVGRHEHDDEWGSNDAWIEVL